MTHRFTAILLRILPLALLATACSPSEPPVPGMKIGKPYAIQGRTYVPAYDPGYDKTGEASWYGPGFHGKYTASGEKFNQDDMTAAHPTLPMPSMVRVTNLSNGRSAIVRINDRGPFKSNRIIDLSRASARELGITSLAKVRVQYLADETGRYIAAFKDNNNKPLSMATYNQRKVGWSPEDQIVEANVATTQVGQTVTEAAPIQSISSSDLGGSVKGQDLPVLVPQANAPQANAAEPEEDEEEEVAAAPFNPPVKEKRYIRDETGKPVQLKGAKEAQVASAAEPKRFSPIKAAEAAEVKPAASSPAPAAGGIHIQVGAFSSEENARKLDGKLSGIAAVNIAKMQAGGKDLWRVRLGPFASKDDASAALLRVHEAGLADARITY